MIGARPWRKRKRGGVIGPIRSNPDRRISPPQPQRRRKPRPARRRRPRMGAGRAAASQSGARCLRPRSRQIPPVRTSLAMPSLTTPPGDGWRCGRHANVWPSEVAERSGPAARIAIAAAPRESRCHSAIAAHAANRRRSIMVRSAHPSSASAASTARTVRSRPRAPRGALVFSARARSSAARAGRSAQSRQSAASAVRSGVGLAALERELEESAVRSLRVWVSEPPAPDPQCRIVRGTRKRYAEPTERLGDLPPAAGDAAC
jgi:hypothetical protein